MEKDPFGRTTDFRIQAHHSVLQCAQQIQLVCLHSCRQLDPEAILDAEATSN